MRTISEKDLTRMRKKSGVKVRRKRSAKKSPKSGVAVTADLSGAASTEAPTSALRGK